MKGINEEDRYLLKKEDFSPRTWARMTKNLREGQSLYSLKHFDTRMGFVTMTEILDLRRATTYICKYITKDCIRNSAGYIYINSRGLKTPISYNILPLDMDFLGAWSNDYCKIFDFDVTTLPYEKLLYLINNIHSEQDYFVSLFAKDEIVIDN